jgi:hypothetical protein
MNCILYEFGKVESVNPGQAGTVINNRIRRNTTIYIVLYYDRIPLNRVLWKRLKRSAQPFKTEKRSAFYQSPESLKNGCRQENKCHRGWQNCLFFVKNHFQRVWALLKTGFFGALKDCSFLYSFRSTEKYSDERTLYSLAWEDYDQSHIDTFEAVPRWLHQVLVVNYHPFRKRFF